jgi:hypothetical protein
VPLPPATAIPYEPLYAFLGDLAVGEMSLEPVDRNDTLRIAELVARYHHLPLGTVDASVVAALGLPASSKAST